MITSYSEILFATCLLILPLLYQSSHVFKYYTKYAFYILHCLTMSTILLPIFSLRPRNVKNLVIGAYFCRVVTSFIGLKWILRNTQYLAEEKPMILVGNHQSILDTLGLFMLWPIAQKLTVIAKKEIFYFWPLGLAAWLGGLIFIPRSQSEKSKHIMHETVEYIKKKNMKVIVFPEGKRYSDGQIHSFKKGAFHMAIQGQLPILPVVYSQYSFLNHNKKRFDSGKVIITVLPPISTEGKTLDDLDDLIEETRRKITTTFHEVNKEICETNDKL